MEELKDSELFVDIQIMQLGSINEACDSYNQLVSNSLIEENVRIRNYRL